MLLGVIYLNELFQLAAIYCASYKYLTFKYITDLRLSYVFGLYKSDLDSVYNIQSFMVI